MESNANNHVCLIIGTRPNFVKAAPLITALKKEHAFRLSVLHAGQHYDVALSEILLHQLGIGRPDKTLDISAYSDRHIKIGQMISKITKFLTKRNITMVIVVGDVDATLAGALAAAKLNLPVLHVEAGLRSHDLRMPEEFNRFIVDQVSSLHFITEPSARKNLLNEGFHKSSIMYVGNLMIENLIHNKTNIDKSRILQKLRIQPKTYLVATIHRFENITSNDTLRKILQLLRAVSKKYTVVFPIHPHTLKQIKKFNLQAHLRSLVTTPALGYFEFLKLVSLSCGVITDSGGIQEETTFLQIPCCTLRDTTERPITIDQGTNKLFPLDATPSSIEHHLNHPPHRAAIRYWDNKVSQRIIAAIRKAYYTG